MHPIARLTAAVLLLWLPATAAHADPAGPTNYSSTLTEVPDVPGVTVSVFGGDAFLVIEVAPGSGHEVIVHGYAHSDEVSDVFLRILEDGTVESNRRSPAHWQNLDRYAAVELPASVDPSAPPDWEVVGIGGRHAWHDHRIHWMSSALPPTIDPDGGVQVVPALGDWRIPIEIDGVPYELAGTLTWHPSPSPIPWVALAALVLLAASLLARRTGRGLWLAILASAVAALAVGVASSVGVPPGAGVPLPAMLLPVASLAVALAWRPSRDDPRVWFVAAAGLPLVAWAMLHAGAMTRPIMPSDVPVPIIRAVIVAAVGVTLGAVVAGLSGLFGGSLEDLAALAGDED